VDMDHHGNGQAEGNGGTQARLQELAIQALLTSRSIKKAAAKAGVDPGTLYNWLKDPAFKAAYAAARQEILDDAIGALKAASRRALAALERNLKAPKPCDQIKAAAVLLAHALRARELDEVEKRLRALEKRVRRETRSAY
jgi:hypothetical protein